MVPFYIRRLDSFLFGEQTVTTTRTVKQTIPYASMDEKMKIFSDLLARGYVFSAETCSTIGAEALEAFGMEGFHNEEVSRHLDIEMVDGPEGHLSVDGKDLTLPQSVVNRPPLIVNGVVNHASYPDYRKAPFSSSAAVGTTQVAFHRGIPLSRSANAMADGLTKHDVMKLHARYESLQNLATDDDTDVLRCRFEYLDLSCTVSDDYIYLRVSDDDEVMIVEISQKNIGQIKSDGEAMLMAYAYARIFLLTLAVTSQPITGFDEDKIAKIILGMFLAEKGQIS